MYSVKKENGFVMYNDAEESRNFKIPESNFMGLYTAGNPKAMLPEQIEKAVVFPFNGGERLSDIVKKKKASTASVIISDATRGVPTAKVAPFVVKELIDGGIDIKNIIFVVALGVHRNAEEEEMKEFLGELYGKVRIENHDAFSEDKLVYLGDTSRKTPVKVNKTVYESDIKVTIGKVELHDMAGFSGGRKSILPGVCAEETIVINHRPEKMIDPNSRAGNLENNPIHEDMLETARMCGVDYSVNIVMNMDYEIAGIFSGDLDLSHRAAAEFLKKYCNVELPKKPDVFVVCPGKPLSIDMYQGVKAIIAFHKITDSNTTVILYGSFEEGINSKDFYEPFKKYKDLDELKKFVWENYEIQMDHIIPIMEMLKKKTKIVVITENVSKEEIEDMGMKKAESLQTAVDEALGGEKEKLVAICPQSYRCIFSIKK